MIEAILVGSALIIATVVVESLFIAVAVKGLNKFGPRLRGINPVVRMAGVLTTLTLWLLAGISAAMWMWALLFLMLGEFDTLLDAVYFASVSATTGDSDADYFSL